MSSSALLPVARAIDEALASATGFATERRTRRDPATLFVTVALSGGRDSMALLDALASAAPRHGITLTAAHVHHGLSTNAERWAEFCAAECARRSIPFAVHRVRVEDAAALGIEAAARAARYRVFASLAADFIAIAHHAGDQSETLLLQLLRGSGPHGLAAMPLIRALPSGGALLRPLIALPDAVIGTYAEARGLMWIHDESNEDRSLRRNFLRHEIAPRLAAVFPGYPATLARAAQLQSEAAGLLDELAAIDAHEALFDRDAARPELDRRTYAALVERAPQRAKNLLRWFLRQHGLRSPSAARLEAMQRQLAQASDDARVRLVHDGVEIGIHRGRILVHLSAIAPFVADWHGEPAIALPHGTLEFVATEGTGLAAARLAAANVVIRPRSGGERIRIDRDRPRQAVKRLMQTAGIPHWQRDALPFVWCGDSLAAVPGLGVDIAFAAGVGESGFDIRWHPEEPVRRRVS
jgi:tRNA(Ile)-lysidine synthase